jgi:hypothetical protein
MPKLTSPLDHIKIAAPCFADWDQMFSFEGERVRFCSQCNLNVYNLSDMSRQEAEALVTKTEGRLCVRFYRRADGSILTQNCPAGLRAIKRRVAWAAQVILGMVSSLVPVLGLYTFVQPPVHMGAMSYAPPPKRGELRVDPGQSKPESHGKAKRHDQGVIQAAPETSSATSPAPSRKNP